MLPYRGPLECGGEKQVGVLGVRAEIERGRRHRGQRSREREPLPRSRAELGSKGFSSGKRRAGPGGRVLRPVLARTPSVSAPP